MGRKRLATNRDLPPNLYKNSAGYFYYVNPNSKESKGIGRDKAKAFSQARAANAVLATMKPSSLADWVAGKVDYTLADWLPVYKELWLGKEKRAENTKRSCVMYLNRLEKSDFAWMRLSELTAAHIAPYIRLVEKESGAASALCMRARMSDVFRCAETEGLIDVGKNPVTATYIPSRTVKRERLSLEQFHAIHAQAPTWLQHAMFVALLTGQRRDDIAQMKFADYRDGYLYVVQGKGKGDVKLQLHGAIRLDQVGMSIGDAVQNCRDRVVSPFLIHHVEHNGSALPGNRISSNGISTAFTNARDAAGIKAQEGRTPPTFHEIRSLSERLYKAQFGADFAQAMLGHKNASMTEKYDSMRGGWKTIMAK